MVVIPDLPQFVVLEYTATSDDVFRLTTVDKWLMYADVFVYDNDAYLGDVTGQVINIITNDIYEIPYPINAAQIFAKNVGAGANTRIVLVGLEMSDKQLEALMRGSYPSAIR